MEGLAVLLIGLSAIAASQETAYAQYRANHGYYQPAYVAQADTGYPPAYAYPPAYVYAPAPQPVVGAVTGSLIGAAAGGGPGAALGAVMGGVIGHAAAVAPYAPVAPAYAAPAYAQAAPARDTQFTDQYVQRWQGFMEPAGRR